MTTHKWMYTPYGLSDLNILRLVFFASMSANSRLYNFKLAFNHHSGNFFTFINVEIGPI